ncbi:MAG: hypothetical protein GY761_21935 [Hyphomicrobiales bacterium]|nr:hypothetical protein [Hyphomicrobiales bacterium]
MSLVIASFVVFIWFLWRVFDHWRDGRQETVQDDQPAGEKPNPTEISWWTQVFFGKPLTAALLVISLALLGFTSYVWPDGDQIATLDRKLFCSPMPDNQVVALPGQCGRQAAFVKPGFQFSPWIRALNAITYTQHVTVPEGKYATLSTYDGIELDPGQVAARPWSLSEVVADDGTRGTMLDPVFFLTAGKGRKGPQATILTPGTYMINPYLWNADGPFDRIAIAPGHSGVIRSALDEAVVPPFMSNANESVTCGADKHIEKKTGTLRAVLVPVGCRGVWDKPLPAGEYYLNEKIYTIKSVDNRLQNWVYKGGYTRRWINLTVDEKGQITQEEGRLQIKTPASAAGPAIIVKVEGWDVHQELRLQASVTPDKSPLVVAAVGGLQEVEDRIITPQVRSILRNIGGSRLTVLNTAAYEEALADKKALEARLAILLDTQAEINLNPQQREAEAADLKRRISGFVLPDATKRIVRSTRVLDFQNEREALENLTSSDIKRVGAGAGIEIASVKFGNADLPPELLVARKQEQLAGQMQRTFIQKRLAQVQRQATEAAQSRADKQGALVEASIQVETSELKIKQQTNLGIAAKEFDTNAAAGREALANVLGKDRVVQLQALELILNTLKENPEILGYLKLPSTLSINNGGGVDLNSVAGILSGTKLFGGPVDSNKAN